MLGGAALAHRAGTGRARDQTPGLLSGRRYGYLPCNLYMCTKVLRVLTRGAGGGQRVISTLEHSDERLDGSYKGQASDTRVIASAFTRSGESERAIAADGTLRLAIRPPRSR